MTSLLKKADFKAYWERALSFSKALDTLYTEYSKNNDIKTGYAMYDIIFHMIEFYARALLLKTCGIMEGKHKIVFEKFKEKFCSKDRFKTELVDFYEKIMTKKDAIEYQFEPFDKETFEETKEYAKQFEKRAELLRGNTEWQ